MTRAARKDSEKAARKPTNLSLDAHLVDQARQLGINLSRACEQGLAARIAEEQARRWCADNAEALAASNRFVETNGLPLGALRRF